MALIALASLDRSGLPLQGAEPPRACEVPLIRRERCYAVRAALVAQRWQEESGIATHPEGGNIRWTNRKEPAPSTLSESQKHRGQ
jgi:hypothetical protein